MPADLDQQFGGAVDAEGEFTSGLLVDLDGAGSDLASADGDRIGKSDFGDPQLETEAAVDVRGADELISRLLGGVMQRSHVDDAALARVDLDENPVKPSGAMVGSVAGCSLTFTEPALILRAPTATESASPIADRHGRRMNSSCGCWAA